MQQPLAVEAAPNMQSHRVVVAQLDLIAEVFPSGVLAVNQEGQIILANAELRKTFGYDRHELLGQPIELLVPENVREKHVQHRSKFLASPSVVAMGATGCLRGRRKDGSTLYLQIGLAPIETEDGVIVLCAVADVTVRKEVERKLDESLSLERAIFETTSYGIIATDPKGTVSIFNHAAERMLGYGAAEVVGQKTPVAIHDREEIAARAEELSAALDRAVAPGFEVFVAKLAAGGLEEREWTYVRKDGSRFPVLLSVTAMRDPQGNITGYVGIFKDITKRREAEDRLKEAKHAAELANRAKSEFLSAMSHELRTPLNAIIGFSQGLLERTDRHPLSDHQKDRIEKIHRSGLHLLSLINDILDIAKVESGKVDITPTTFGVGQVVSDVRDLLAGLAREKPRLAIRVDIASALPPITTDREKLRQILINLSGNAVKFTDEGTITLAVRQEGNHFVFSVADTGIGIAEDEVERVFEKFHQVRQATSSTIKGSGLGLTICKQFAALLGGSLGVSSRLGKGSTFELRLPLRIAASADDATSPPVAIEPDGGLLHPSPMPSTTGAC
jgi:PAS domain S-box-containing protein